MPKSNTEQILELSAILDSEILKDILAEHKEFLQREVNRAVKEQKLTEAYGTLCKLEDFNQILKLVQKRIEDLKKEK